VSGLNGTQPALRTTDAPVTRGIGHYLVTVRDGMETLYVNGKARASVLLRSQESLSDIIIQTIGKPFKWLIYSVLIFPLAILTVLFFQQQNCRWCRLGSLGAVLMATSSIQMLRPLAVGGSLEPHFLPVSVMTIFAAVLLFRPPTSTFR
jgi:hypothetical protein